MTAYVMALTLTVGVPFFLCSSGAGRLDPWRCQSSMSGRGKFEEGQQHLRTIWNPTERRCRNQTIAK